MISFQQNEQAPAYLNCGMAEGEGGMWNHHNLDDCVILNIQITIPFYGCLQSAPYYIASVRKVIDDNSEPEPGHPSKTECPGHSHHWHFSSTLYETIWITSRKIVGSKFQSLEANILRD
jgi:hypothetical protein